MKKNIQMLKWYVSHCIYYKETVLPASIKAVVAERIFTSPRFDPETFDENSTVRVFRPDDVYNHGLGECSTATHMLYLHCAFKFCDFEIPLTEKTLWKPSDCDWEGLGEHMCECHGVTIEVLFGGTVPRPFAFIGCLSWVDIRAILPASSKRKKVTRKYAAGGSISMAYIVAS
jgi:hypothetical protein